MFTYINIFVCKFVSNAYVFTMFLKKDRDIVFFLGLFLLLARFWRIDQLSSKANYFVKAKMRLTLIITIMVKHGEYLGGSVLQRLPWVWYHRFPYLQYRRCLTLSWFGLSGMVAVMHFHVVFQLYTNSNVLLICIFG